MPPPPSSPRDVHVLITGFGPFSRTSDNPSWLASRPLNGTKLTLDNGTTVHITALEVRVVYASVLYLVPGFHARPPVIPPLPDLPQPPADGYDFVFHIGLGASGAIAIEQQAHKSGYALPDVDGKLAPIITVDGKTGEALRGFAAGFEAFGKDLQTTINIEGLVAHLQEGDKNVRLSTDPGRYLCDFIYYCSLAESRRLPDAVSPKRSKCLFMHVPPLSDPHSLEELTTTIRKVVSWVAQN
ncbi:peptidase C15, pyroglutamyl peptidase I-like protein [Auricularia subglabra TFB-10046 SS5]|nr:peptidase C15, pyroglutamyl peptidase I-like protein [Auricularia subglabra TFB-10046 SS5]